MFASILQLLRTHKACFWAILCMVSACQSPSRELTAEEVLMGKLPEDIITQMSDSESSSESRDDVNVENQATSIKEGLRLPGDLARSSRIESKKEQAQRQAQVDFFQNLQGGNKKPAVASGDVSLQNILRTSLTQDPVILEAHANEQAAKSRADATFAQHYPTLAVQGNRPIAQQHKNSANDVDEEFKPSINANLNLFSWWGIQNQVNRDKEKARYFYYKYYESREELGKSVATEYIDAIFYREALVALQENLKRHQGILGNLDIIIANDSGRRSEWIQAKAREVQVRQTISSYQSNLQTSLSHLEKYLGRSIKAEDLVDPFPQKEPAQVLKLSRTDLKRHPTYLAQAAELESVRYENKVTKSALLPSVNLTANADRDNNEVYINLNWNLFNRTNMHTVNASAQELVAAQSRLDQVERDIAERSRTAIRQMEQSKERLEISREQIESNRNVVHAYELQFKIARKTLIELLNAYSDLASVELSAVNAEHEFRTSAISYLNAHHKIATWAGVAEQEYDKRYIEEAESSVEP